MVDSLCAGIAEKWGCCLCETFCLEQSGKWRGHIDVDLSDRALYEIYLPAFKAAVQKGGAWSIMGAYNKIRGTMLATMIYC